MWVWNSYFAVGSAGTANKGCRIYASGLASSGAAPLQPDGGGFCQGRLLPKVNRAIGISINAVPGFVPGYELTRIKQYFLCQLH